MVLTTVEIKGFKKVLLNDLLCFRIVICFQFNWKRYFSKLTEGLGDKVFSDSEEVYVETPIYLKELWKILKKTPQG